jgi:manganese/zinc/iron transport system permease protein
MESFLDFFALSDPNVRFVLSGAILLTACSAIIGCFTLLRKRALIGDAIAHSVLPGVCLSFILWKEKNPLILMTGAFISGWISVAAMDFITKKSRIKEDAALGLVLSVFFGFGILLLTYIQHSGNAQQTGLDHFLFGKITSLVQEDLIVLIILAITIIVAVIVLFKEFTLISFDEKFAVSIGLPVKLIKTILTSLTVLAVVVGIQAVGVVLMAAMLVTPAAAARFWTDKITTMILLAALIGAISGVAGSYISYVAHDMPTGPWIVLIISFSAILSFVFAPHKGILYRYYQQYKNRKKILEENILKAFFQMGEKEEDYFRIRTIETINFKRNLGYSRLKKGLSSLAADGFVEKKESGWILTAEGKNKGQRITRIHRLWELYLTNYLNIAADHVHEDAETIEHILTPELEKRLEEILDRPSQDPHSSSIPYNK